MLFRTLVLFALIAISSLSTKVGPYLPYQKYAKANQIAVGLRNLKKLILFSPFHV